MSIAGIQKKLKIFWKEEKVATEVYSFLTKRAHPEKKDLFREISSMEKGHAAVWNHISEKEFSRMFKPRLGLKIRIFIMKLLALLLPLPIIVHYLEFEERNAIFQYSKMLELFKDEKTHHLIEGVIRDEILHETHMFELLLDKMAYLGKTRQAIQGFTISLMKIFALLIGVLAIIPDPLSLLVTGIIFTIGGAIATFASSFVSAKGHKDIQEGRITEIKIKEEVHPEALKRDLKNALIEKGIQESTTEEILAIIGDDVEVLGNLVKSIRVSPSAVPPRTSAFVTGAYFFLGALPVIVPFIFPPIFPSFSTMIAAIVAAAVAIIVSFIAGLFIAILSGKKMLLYAVGNVLIILVTAGLTYLIGFGVQRIFGL